MPKNGKGSAAGLREPMAGFVVMCASDRFERPRTTPDGARQAKVRLAFLQESGEMLSKTLCNCWFLVFDRTCKMTRVEPDF